MTIGGGFDLPDAPLPIFIPAGTFIVRVHQIKDGVHWFGPAPGGTPGYRFDAPAGEFRMLYAAERLEGAFVETVLRKGNRIVARAYVNLRQWTIMRTLRDLKLLKLFDTGLVFHAVTGDICTGDNYGESQAFAAAVHAKYPDIDGIAYRARHNNGEICYALFDRVQPSQLPAVISRQFAHERSITDDLVRQHGASIDPMAPFLPP
jgi:hypothetical protein